MSEKIIFFDIDDTLIDSSNKLGLFFYQNIADQAKIDVQKVVEAKNKYKLILEKSTDYCPDNLVIFICKELGIKRNKILDPFENKYFYRRSLFSESKITLEELSKDYTLGIFSEGFVEYQSKKIGLSGLIKYFDKDLIFIKRRKLSLESINEIPYGAIVIDDKKEVIKTLSETRPDLELVWVNRIDQEKSETPRTRTIKSLDELLAIY